MPTEPMSVEIKPCKNCGTEIARRKYPCGSWEGPRAYARRQYCSPFCAQQSARQTQKYRSHAPMRVRRSGEPIERGHYTPKPTRVSLRFLEYDVPITAWETSRWDRRCALQKDEGK